MTDDLRTRIAMTACGATASGKLFPWETLSEVMRDSWREVADAVIGELGLRIDRQQGPYNFLYRYVTDWTTDEIQ